MADRFLLEQTPDGIQEWMIWDEADDKLHLETTQDVQAVLDRNAALRNSGVHDAGVHSRMKYVASIPIAVLALWEQTYGVDDILADENADLLKRLLNDPDWSKLRIWSGHV